MPFGTPCAILDRMAYTSSSAQDRLDRIRARIEAILDGQEITTGRNSVKKPDIKVLFKREAELEEIVAQESAGSMSTVAILTRPT